MNKSVIKEQFERDDGSGSEGRDHLVFSPLCPRW